MVSVAFVWQSSFFFDFILSKSGIKRYLCLHIVMRSFISISLVFLFAWQLLLKAGVLMWYGANRTYIAAELCENRDKPEMQCNGQCVLAKRMKAAEQERRDADQRPLRIMEKFEFSHYIAAAEDTFSGMFETDLSRRIVWASYLEPHSNYFSNFFHPPEL